MTVAQEKDSTENRSERVVQRASRLGPTMGVETLLLVLKTEVLWTRLLVCRVEVISARFRCSLLGLGALRVSEKGAGSEYRFWMPSLELLHARMDLW